MTTLEQQNITANLAGTVEVLEKPDRTIDWWIHARNGIDGIGSYGSHPRFTESLDAALMLVPGYHKWLVGSSYACVWHEDSRLEEAPRFYTKGGRTAIAMCAAALYAEDLQRSKRHRISGSDAADDDDMP